MNGKSSKMEAMMQQRGAALSAALGAADPMDLFVGFIQRGMNLDQQCTVIANLLKGIAELKRADGQPLDNSLLRIRNAASRAFDEFMRIDSTLIAPAGDLIGSGRG